MVLCLTTQRKGWVYFILKCAIRCCQNANGYHQKEIFRHLPLAKQLHAVGIFAEGIKFSVLKSIIVEKSYPETKAVFVFNHLGLRYLEIKIGNQHQEQYPFHFR